MSISTDPERRGLPGLAYPEEYLRRLALDLSSRFEGVFNAETVERYVLESYAALLRTSSVHAHLAIRTVRFATDRLTALATAKGALSREVPTVLFVCERNAGRSQMAAALVSHLSGGRVHARSAGSVPSAGLLPAVVEAMAELGIDISKEFPKPLTDDVVQAADAVVTMGCGDACPVYPGKQYEDWRLEDPDGEPLEAVRRIRDDIAVHVRELLATL
ncbi:arsenate reductase ArsC [Lysobacter korlensis]|uniref:Arsenate reductase ArsC n=1 Tax=Lysobacter korlensis TaxID=553636 RepID=A0ABV6RV28_9GAMM